jgi:glutamate dehydrogenase (NADP+)
MEYVRTTHPNQPEFHQAVEEFSSSVFPYIHEHTKYQEARILERLIEPERTISFRITWTNDQGGIEINRGYRVQFSSAIGPYKGGLRFHPSVNLSILKFLGFEQIFKNSLTMLPLGGAKGGSDFDPKGRSDAEVMRFCQAFMAELYRHIGADTDVPAGDIGVGGREIGYLFGQYKKLENQFTGVLTGKGFGWGGSLLRPEATGYGAVYFAESMLHTTNQNIEGKTVVISGSGNVAQGVAEKVIQLGGKVVSFSDSDGSVYHSDGITQEKLDFIKELKNMKRGRIKEFSDHFGGEYMAHEKPWAIKADLYFPCATQNELEEDDAQLIVNNHALAVVEGANMPTTLPATELLQKSGVLFAPGKASNAGGVATSGLEMTQNSERTSWSTEEVDAKLKHIMHNIHKTCVLYGAEDGKTNYVKGANIGGFVRVANAMIDQGVV